MATTFAAERCEFIEAESGGVLRVRGRWLPATPASVELFVPAGDGGVLCAPAAPGATVSEDGTWSASFRVELSAAPRRLALVPVGGGFAALHPADRVIARGADALALRLAEAEASVERHRRSRESAERSQAGLRKKLVRAWAEAGDLRNLLDEREAPRTHTDELRGLERSLLGDAAVAPETDPDQVTVEADLRPWTAVDHALLSRITRAGQLVGER